jgi:hypothetical protein
VNLKLERRLDLSQNQQLIKKMGLIKEILALLEQEEDYWLSRCHEHWLLKGDNNTSYFHKIANGRMRKMTIVSLEKGWSCD